jgi:hypothetical protein
MHCCIALTRPPSIARMHRQPTTPRAHRRGVEVEIRESVVIRYVGPKLLKPVYSTNLTAELLEPLTPTLGLSICNTSTPWAEGTGGFYVTGDSKLYLVAARHVVFKPDPADNDTYEYKVPSQARVNVALFGTAAYNSYVE